MAQDLYNNKERYMKLIKVYHKHSDEYEVEVPWVKSRLGEHLLKQYPEDHTIRILSIGCGIGIKDFALLETLKGRKVDYTALDWSAEAMHEFKKKVVDSNKFQDVTFQLFTISSEDFAERESHSTYDLICALHMVYGMKSPSNYIAKYRSLLAPEGLLVILVVAPDCHKYILRVDKLGLGLVSCDVGAIIKQLGYDHWKERITHHVDISSWFVSSSLMSPKTTMSEEAKDLLGFMAYIDTMEYESSARLSEFMESMREVSVRDGAKLWFPVPSDAFFIKPKSSFK